MRSEVRRALGWALRLVLLVGCTRGDAADSVEHSKPAEKPVASTDGEEPDARLADLERRAFPLLVWAAHTIDKEYFDRQRFDPPAQLLSALSNLGLHTPEFFAEPNADGSAVTVRVRASESEFRLDDVDSLAAAADRLEEVLVFAQQQLDLDEEPLHELEYAAINGMFAPLDPHTILLTPEEHTDLGVRTKGEFGGVGAQIRADGRRIVIMRVLPGMPAERAGVLAGDIILKVGEQSTMNMTAAEAQVLLRGPVGSKVLIKVRRKKAVLPIEIERDTIRVQSVVAEDLPGDVKYLRITTFQENTAEQVRAALAGAKGEQPKGVVFDLRGNSGGLLVQATEIVDQFVSRGELVIVRSGFGREVDDATEPTLLPGGVGVVILVDEESASAAEIVSGGLKALRRAVVVGRGSFGKGTVQVVRPANPYGRELALKLTVAEYLVAGDQRIQTSGVVPDLELQPVEPTGAPGIVRYYDAERFERARERSRMANHPSAKHELKGMRRQEPAATLRYLQAARVPAAGGPDVMRDPEVRIAREVAIGLRGTTEREARIAQLKSVAAKVRAEEDVRITEALTQAKLDWSREAAPSSVKLGVSAQVTSASPIPAGEPFTLEVKITNESSDPAHRVHIITDCVHDELDGIELMVGRIDGGETVVRELKPHVMPWHSDFTDELTLDVHVGEPDADADATTQVRFDVKGADKPSLAYDFWLVDDPQLAKHAPQRPASEPIPGEPAFAVQGNGDGLLQPGERVLLAFTAHNGGPGRSPDARAALRNLSGKQGLIEEGLVPLGVIEAGGSKSGAFGITVGAHADPSLPFELDLVVGDGVQRTAAQHKLRFRVVAKAPTLDVAEDGVTVKGESVRLYGGAHPSSRVVAEASPGTKLLLGGKYGNWRVVESADRSRRLFVPGDLEALSSTPAVTQSELGKLDQRILVQPPRVELEEYPRATSAATVALRGTVTHPQGVRDVLVMVRPPGPSQFDRKVSYKASAKLEGTLAFEADVPLEPGGNRIAILARDGAKVQRRRDIWIFRTP